MVVEVNHWSFIFYFMSSLFLVFEASNVSDETADVVDVVYVNMQLDPWCTFRWVKEQGENS
jgi:hypothetical protein